MKMRSRIEESANYKSVFINGKTLRFAIDNNKEITELKFAEFLDISMGNFCSGSCPYCYASALKTGKHYTNLAEKIMKFFGPMTENQRPYQVACGGEGESIENPECWEAMEAFNNLGIVPNLTSNGMFINDDTITKIKKYCGGIALTNHPHLKKYWERALELLHEANIKLNLHVIISDERSIDGFRELYKKYRDKIDYFVLLPYMNVGHAEKRRKNVLLDKFETEVDSIYKEGKLAFGANFYSFLVKNKEKYKLNLYTPEIFSKYLLLNDKLEVFNNSFEKQPVPYSIEDGCELGHARSHFDFTNFVNA